MQFAYDYGFDREIVAVPETRVLAPFRAKRREAREGLVRVDKARELLGWEPARSWHERAGENEGDRSASPRPGDDVTVTPSPQRRYRDAGTAAVARR